MAESTGGRRGGDNDTDTDFDAVLLDGTLIHLRPPRPADRPALTELLTGLSPQSAYLRFFSLSQRAPRRYLDLLLSPDETDLPGLVALVGGRPVAVASYERPGGGDEAEVAFVVDDAHQGLGISTLLLETLAADATRRGITRFTAEVLPENEAMLDVFRAAGFATSPRFREGTVRVEFPLTRTEVLVEAVGGRERLAAARSIARLLRPDSIVVVGGSSPDDVGPRIVRNLRTAGYTGALSAVPGSRSWAPTVESLPAGADLGILTGPAEEVLPVARACAAAGVRNLLVTSSGYSDAGPAGAGLEADLLALARGAGMRLVGPHSLGIVNTAADVRLCALPTDSCPQPGPVGMLAQSPALGVAMLRELARRGIGVSTFLSTGNSADVSGNDLLMYWEQDPATTVVVLCIERFGNPRKFARIARRVARSKPVLVVASGRSAAGARTGASRSLAPSDPAAVEALFRQTGVIRLDRVDELFAVLEVLLTEPLPRGRRIAVVGNSGAAAALAADAAVAGGLIVPELDGGTQGELGGSVPSAAAVINPIVLGETAGPDVYASALPVLLQAGEVDAVLISHALYPGTRRTDVATVSDAVGHSAKPVVASVLGARRALDPNAGRRVPTFRFPETAARALAAIIDYAQWRDAPAGHLPDLSDIDAVAAGAMLGSVLVDSPAGATLPRADAERLLAHYAIAVQPAGQAHPGDATNWTVGVVQDPLFGPLVSFGGGGLAIELYQDAAHHILPLTDADASRLVRSLRSSPLLFGYQGAPPLATAALEDLLLRVGRLAENHREVVRLVIDPVLVTRSDAVVGDVRVHVAPAVRAPSAWLRRLR